MIRELGAELVAISPQTRAKNAETKKGLKLEFPLLADPRNAYAAELGLAFELPTELRKVYEGFGLSLPEANGDDSWTLPVPTRLVVDAEGVIRRVDADPDYTVRPEPELTLDALRSLRD